MLLDLSTAGARLQRVLGAGFALQPDLLLGSIALVRFLLLAPHPSIHDVRERPAP